jgi:hypothetical protein
VIYKRLLATACLLTLAAGTASAADTKVSGRVTLDGTPLAAGKLTCYLENGEFVGTVVKDGEFAFDKVRLPAGSFTVTIEGNGVPAKYGRENASSLSIKVVEGANLFNFELLK